MYRSALALRVLPGAVQVNLAAGKGVVEVAVTGTAEKAGGSMDQATAKVAVVAAGDGTGGHVHE